MSEQVGCGIDRRSVLKTVSGASAAAAGIVAAATGPEAGAVPVLPATSPDGSWAEPSTVPVEEGWLAKRLAAGDSGERFSGPGTGFSVDGWIRARVPGTVLATLADRGLVPDPYFGLNNLQIPDAGEVGVGQYTYWFRTRLDVPKTAGRHNGRVFLDLRGVNYKADVYLNGSRITPEPLTGMFLRRKLDVTGAVRPGGENVLAVLVTPPDPPGDPRSGVGEFEPAGTSCQGGDQLIGRSVTAQVTAGWDFWQPVRDRNTGLWDRVSLNFTGPVVFASDPKITTEIAWRGSLATRAVVSVTASARNTAATAFPAQLQVRIGKRTVKGDPVTVGAGETKVLTAAVTVDDPQLWWPHGYGTPHLYPVTVDLLGEGRQSQTYRADIGIRELSSAVDPTTTGRKFTVNKTPVFIRGGAWVTADALLRLSARNYDDQVRLHQQANLNLIRVWGGSITERPEFYQACDKYGVLVWQEFWVTADCTAGSSNPADRQLFLDSARDAVRMLRNHPSLCLWVGGNEGPPPGDLDSRLSALVQAEDGTRPYVSYSTDPDAGLGTGGQFSDGPYGILYPFQFFDGTWTEHRTSTGAPQPFTPETGSVGTPVAETIRAIMSKADAEDFPKVTQATWPPNKAWNFHLWIPFFAGDSTTKDQLVLYQQPATLDEFCEQAQAAQYQQYKAMFEGRNAAMWRWYTGGVIWRSAPGWTGLRGQLYDWHLEQTGGYWGVRKAGEPLHPQLDLSNLAVAVVNNTRQDSKPTHLTITVVGPDGRVIEDKTRQQDIGSVPAAGQQTVTSLADVLTPNAFQLVKLQLRDRRGRLVADNTDWLYNAPGPQPDLAYAPLRNLARSHVTAHATRGGSSEGTVEIVLRNHSDVIAFHVRIQLVGARSGKRVTPFFLTDNYLTLLPGESRTVQGHFHENLHEQTELLISGWNASLEDSGHIPIRQG
ncbi:glycoside hydrolase family 2 TIM barrel-domain containing protein [Streptomyces sp. WAC06614]|uniref:glycoside hydrolase family 2 protein n=1 Tax=Streptomyces sp. WAC06614 TaxID=2487416 RepID=UPI00163C9616|nr:glycoside hydrolase family 2 TIM barrel-domain containing protein [Streptomyces sp. WAC06614]